MIELEVLCKAKFSRLGAGGVINDITFQPVNMESPTHAIGAVIGIPDPNNLQTVDKESYNLISGSVTISVTDPKEADKYQVGQTFKLSVNAIKSSK